MDDEGVQGAQWVLRWTFGEGGAAAHGMRSGLLCCASGEWKANMYNGYGTFTKATGRSVSGDLITGRSYSVRAGRHTLPTMQARVQHPCACPP